ncbi:hypothetical protein GQ44DRAFT_747612 [Phaeosphaeriaceae sp. PMI808]|nr:hypothetical protein GQ44DRAFT_747612 [Phaeosphaeriaceae sp. PMI808]
MHRQPDPKTPPKKLNRPTRPENLFKSGFNTAPASCTDLMKPSQQCIIDLQAQPEGVNAFSGGELKWDSDRGCSNLQKGKFETAAASGFLSKKSSDIFLSCKDKKNYCPIRKDGRPQKNTGQLFLHEMMHLNSTGQPYIGGERVDPNDTQNWAHQNAYGPSRVHLLARRQINQGGGATRASTNAGSYAWLTNSRYFYDLTGYFPRPSNYKAADDSLSAAQWTREQDGFTLNLGTITGKTTDDEIKNRLDRIVASFSNSPSSSKPSKGKSLSIAMVSAVNSHLGSAPLDSVWNFFTTSVGKAVGSCGETDGEKLTPRGSSDNKISGNVDLENPPWPTGIYKLNIEGEDCKYKCDGTNSGYLFCPNRQISCAEDSLKTKPEGKLKCGARVYFHATVRCDF